LLKNTLFITDEIDMYQVKAAFISANLFYNKTDSPVPVYAF